MDDLLCAAQGDPDQQQSLSKLTICALKEIFPSLLDEEKDSASLKKGLVGEGDWVMVKEVLGWIIETHWVTLALYSKQQIELCFLL